MTLLYLSFPLPLLFPISDVYYVSVLLPIGLTYFVDLLGTWKHRHGAVYFGCPNWRWCKKVLKKYDLPSFQLFVDARLPRLPYPLSLYLFYWWNVCAKKGSTSLRTSLKSHLPAEENVRTPFLPLRNFYNMIKRMKTMAAGANMYADPHLTTTTK